LPFSLRGDFSWSQLWEPTPSFENYKSPSTLRGISIAQKLFGAQEPLNHAVLFDLTHVFTFADDRHTERPAEEAPPDHPPIKAARGLEYSLAMVKQGKELLWRTISGTSF